LILCACLLSVPAFAQDCENDWSARLVSVEGDVERRRAGETDWSPAQRDDLFCTGDALRVLAFGRAAILLPDETMVRVDENTTVTFVPPQNEKRTWLEILRGVIHIISRDSTALEVLTPFGNAGIEGTEFLVVVEDDEATVTVYEGAVAVTNAVGAVSVQSGQSASVGQGRVPLIQTTLRPRDAVQWALHYVPVVNRALPEPDATPSAQQSSDPSFYVTRAARRLGLGRVAEAQEDIAQALRLDANNVDAISLQSIVALTGNDRDEALRLANDAVSRDASSSTALIARSYAQQAFFDISGSLATLQEAVRRDAQNALAWARLSELWLAVGDLDHALSTAQMAVSIDPSLSRTQTVLGFAYLTQVETGQAAQAFERAITLDQGAPLPRLGLGLARIRDGELAAGREQIEISVILDPGNALIRSYMGKTYFEEKRDELADSQLRIAKELDPLDPTAWFYDSIRKQTTNRPVEALRDVQESISLNDNRAVYRSRLLLDEDLAARSAGLARIYRDLDFEQLALIEGWTSVEADPSDYSGHRFLADVYSSLPRHQIARVNELFTSQLLQPINITPIQPQLAEANNFILQNAGPTDLAFNEFNPLFERNRWAIQGSGVVGNNGTNGEDIVVAAVHDRLSVSAGQFAFETDGFRENNDFEQDVANAFLQFRATPNTSLLGEIRSSEVEKGDLEFVFNPNDYSRTQRQTEEVDSARIGARHKIGQRSELIGAVIYQEGELNLSVSPVSGANTKFDGYSVDVQALSRFGRWQLTGGVSRLALNKDGILRRPPPLSPLVSTTGDESAQLYLYSTVGIGAANVVIGGSLDSLETPRFDDDTFHPKFGLWWSIRPRTTLRLAAFRTTQGPLVSRQHIQPRLEPTQVAGFNQFFFGPEGEQAWRYGIALDRTFSTNLHAGIELSTRDIDFPFVNVTTGAPVIVDVAEELARTYVSWVPTDRLGLTGEYQYEKVDNDGRFLAQGFSELRTHRYPVKLNFHSRIGLSAGLTATYVDQSGTFEDLSTPPPLRQPLDDEDSFWVLDASIRYRLPNRLGTVSLSVNNLLDEEFKFQDSDPENPQILPERVVLVKFTLAH
jgi:tetratricopeptide (TPR) repeat protein